MIDRNKLISLLRDAKEYAETVYEDISTGLADGTYEQNSNNDNEGTLAEIEGWLNDVQPILNGLAAGENLGD